ncbi:MAG: hypothetical protein AMXMBFR33_56070 [Candidatus Xenobia bacterium]
MDIGGISIPQTQPYGPRNETRQLELEKLRDEQREKAQELQRRARFEEDLSDCTRLSDSPRREKGCQELVEGLKENYTPAR